MTRNLTQIEFVNKLCGFDFNDTDKLPLIFKGLDITNGIQIDYRYTDKDDSTIRF